MDVALDRGTLSRIGAEFGANALIRIDKPEASAVQLFSWLQSTGLATAVGESVSITAWLSAIHLIGFTILMGAGVAWNLHAAGLLLPGTPIRTVAGTASRLLALGLIISLLTGFALFAPRAPYTATNGIFQLKIALLLAAVIYQAAMSFSVLRKPAVSVYALRASGVLGALLWVALAITACWFILFE